MTKMTTWLLISLLTACVTMLALVGCDDDDDNDIGGDADADADGDGDADSDADADADADAGPDSGVKPDAGEGGGVVIGEWAQIPAGSFWMGSPDGCPGPTGYTGSCSSELGRITNETLHYVSLTRTFEMMSTEVTQGQFETLMGWNPSTNDCTYGCAATNPVYNVTWFDTLAYANELSVDAALTPCFLLSEVGCDNLDDAGVKEVAGDYMRCMNETRGGIDSATVAFLGGAGTPYDCTGYRLPTDAEWEYATRAGSVTAFYPSDGNDGSIMYTGTSPADPNLDQIGWFGGNNSVTGTKPAGGKEANAWGLYDMNGNVCEWVWDWYADAVSPADAVSDPTGPGSASFRGFRGGGWNYDASACRSANRSYFHAPHYRSGAVGFRLVRTLP